MVICPVFCGALIMMFERRPNFAVFNEDGTVISVNDEQQ